MYAITIKTFSLYYFSGLHNLHLMRPQLLSSVIVRSLSHHGLNMDSDLILWYNCHLCSELNTINTMSSMFAHKYIHLSINYTTT